MFQPTQFEFWTMILGGLGLFLFGIYSISKVLKRIASNKLSTVISRCSSNPFLGSLVGCGFTAVIQSSSGTSALAIGLVRAGVMSFVQAAAIIIGANVGTTVTAFIVSIPFMEFFPLVLFIGSGILLLTTRRRWTNIGDLCFAFGCIFFGLWIMDMNLTTLADQEWFVNILAGLNNSPWLGLLIGTIVTAALQSSSAVIGVVQGIYAASIAAAIASGTVASVSLFGILPILFGANIGTTVTAVISCIGGSKDSKRVALFHVLYNVSGALLFMGVLYIAKDWLLTSWSWGLDPKMQLALAHLVFNFITAGIFLPLIKPITNLILKIIKDKGAARETIDIKELDSRILKQFPSEGIILAKEQVVNMFKYSLQMFDALSLYLEKGKAEDADFVKDVEVSIDRIDRQLNEYLMSAEKGDLSEADLLTFTQTLKACKDIERIGDYGENLVDFYENAFENKIKLDNDCFTPIREANKLTQKLIKQTIQVFENNDKSKALIIIKERRSIIKRLDEIISEHFDVLSHQDKKNTDYIDLIFMDIINSYQRVCSHCSNIAKLYGTDKVYVFSDNEEKRFSSLKDRY